MYSIEQFKEKIAKEFQIQFKNENYLKEAREFDTCKLKKVR